jgi:hypothetical protein
MWAGGSFAELRYDYVLWADVPRLNLGKTVRRIRDGRPLRGKRDEINALAAIFIEEAWLRVEKWIFALDSGLPVKRKQPSGKYAFERLPAGALLTKEHSDEIIEEIRESVLTFLDAGVESWRRFREGRRQHPPEGRSAEEARVDRHYELYFEIVASGRQASSATDPRYHVKSGLHTAVNTLLNFFKVMPHVYRGAFHPSTISTAQARMLGEQSRKTMVTLASMQIAYFLNLDKELKKAGADDYDPSRFQIVEDVDPAGQRIVKMKVRDEILDAVRDQTKARVPATGCPALVVQGSSGKSVIAAFYEWMLRVADEQYFPYFDLRKPVAEQAGRALALTSTS